MKKKIFARALSAVLAILLLILPVGCSSSGKTLATLGKQELSVNTYNLLLSRMKGTLSYNEYPVNSDDFWDTIWSTGGATYNDYFCAEIQSELKMMIAKLYLFEEVYGLELPDKHYEEIDELMDEMLDFYFDGSKSAFNAELAAFGVNMKMLREEYVLEDKIQYLTDYITSITGDAAREEYYNANYICFRQILFPLYEYVYETDENGDYIYYKANSNQICYDTKNGTSRTGTDGKTVTDKNGDTIYYLSDGRVAYDIEKGELRGVDRNDDGYVDYELLDEQGKKAVLDRVNLIRSAIEDGDFTTFESYGNEMSEDEIWSSYPDGIYLNVSQNYPQAYLNNITEALKDAENGTVVIIESDNAYHMVMKYSLVSGAYKKTSCEDWFLDFDELLSESIIEAKCQPYLDQITVDEDVLKSAFDMKTVGINLDY